jgi:hypothetical protein
MIFHAGANDDLVDSTTLALSRFRQGGFIRLPSDEEDDIQIFKKKALCIIMATQKHMGRNELIERLTAQVGNKDTAIEILKKRGQMVIYCRRHEKK